MTDDRDPMKDRDDIDELWDDDLDIGAWNDHGAARGAAAAADGGSDDLECLPGPDDGHDFDDGDDGADVGFAPDHDGYSDDDGVDDRYDSEPEDFGVSDDEPEPVAPGAVQPGKRRRSLFRIEKEDDGYDFYDSENEPEPEPEPKPKVRMPRLDPEDPDYWIGEESDIERIIPKPRKVWKWWLAGVCLVVAALVWLWIWFFHPYVDGAVKYGYIKSMERRGTVVKTFEGVLIPYRELGDATPLHFEQLRFSVAGDSLAAHMKGMMLGCVPVRLEYEVYHTPLFWKGAETMVIVKADTADTDKILPPEYR